MNDIGVMIAQWAGKKTIEKADKTLSKMATNKKKGCLGCGCVVPIFIGFFVLVYLL